MEREVMRRGSLRLLPLILLLGLLLSCDMENTLEESLSPFREEAVCLDPQAYVGTVWLGDSEARNERLLIDEAGEARIMLASSTYWLQPVGDKFVLTCRLYRTIHEEVPALTVPVGEARLLSDGSVCRLEVLSDHWHSFSREQETVLFYLSTEPPEDDRGYFIDYINATMAPYVQPNTQWSLRDNELGLELASDNDGRVAGTCVIQGDAVSCELLIGHHGWDVTCALVKKDAQSSEDVLLYGWLDKGTECRYGRLCRIVLQNDSLALCGGKNELILRKQITFDLSEQNWLGMSVYELLFRMGQEGWQTETISLFDDTYPCVFCLHQGEQTLFLFYSGEFGGMFYDDYLTGYALYDGRALQSWAGFRPIDHRVAEAYSQSQDGRFSDFVESPAYVYPTCYYYPLDDCRVAAIKHQTSGKWDETEFTIYDPNKTE